VGKTKRARHLLWRLRIDGGHGALRLCPPYALCCRYNFLGCLVRASLGGSAEGIARVLVSVIVHSIDKYKFIPRIAQTCEQFGRHGEPPSVGLICPTSGVSVNQLPIAAISHPISIAPKN
jgi:hypothetical protein